MAKRFKGVVVGTKMNKTAIVAVERQRAHGLYGKVMRWRKKYHVHDELGVAVGERVIFTETRPMSKTKKWRIVEVAKGQGQRARGKGLGTEGEVEKGKKTVSGRGKSEKRIKKQIKVNKGKGRGEK